MKGLVEQRNDIYLDELQSTIQAMTGKEASIPTIWRALESMGISNKRVSCIPSSTPDPGDIWQDTDQCIS